MQLSGYALWTTFRTPWTEKEEFTTLAVSLNDEVRHWRMKKMPIYFLTWIELSDTYYFFQSSFACIADCILSNTQSVVRKLSHQSCHYNALGTAACKKLQKSADSCNSGVSGIEICKEWMSPASCMRKCKAVQHWGFPLMVVIAITYK